jgi:glycosyltransferase involved in cell wall biosynthesis
LRDVAPLRGPKGRRLRLGHLTTVDMSLSLLLDTELRVDVAAGLDVLGLSAPGPYVEHVRSLGVTHVPIDSLTRSWDLRRDAAAARALSRQLRELDLDILHTHNPKTGVIGRMAGRAGRIPVVVNTCHGLWARRGDPLARRLMVYGAEALAAGFSDYELYQNAEDAHTLRRVVRTQRSRVVGNGTDLERFQFDAAGRTRVRAELGVAPDGLLVGGIGRRVAEKGLQEYAEAARELAGSATFVWVGPADPDKADALSEDLAGVRFVPARSDMPAVYSALDVFVLPSYREGFSRSAMEAAACGRPMVLSDIRGCREIGEDGRHALFVPARDAVALAATIGRLLRDPQLRDRLSRAAAARAHASFDQVLIATVSLHTYADVARRKRLGWTGFAT